MAHVCAVPEEGTGPSETGDGFKSPCGCWLLDPGALQEQQVLLPSSFSFFFFFEWCSKSPLNPFRDEDTKTLTWKLACHIRFLREPVLREEAFRLVPDHFLQVLCSRVWYIYQCGLTFLFWEATRDNNNSLYCFWSLLTPLGQQLKGKFCKPGVCIFVI